MKIELEYLYNINHSKIWSIEQIKTKIIIKFGKKDSKLQEKELFFKDEINAKKEYDKRMNEKISKGYNFVQETKSHVAKLDSGRANAMKEHNFVQETKSHVAKLDSGRANAMKESITLLETINPFINYLNKISEMYHNYYENYRKIFSKDVNIDLDSELNKKMLDFHNKNIQSIEKYIAKVQNKKIMPFTKSGIIVKKLNKNLKNTLLSNINIFLNKSVIDYHPNSNKKVIDIVHPSLYPLIRQNKKTNKSSKLDYWGRTYEKSTFQWLPSEFKIDDNGKCTIESYINNLPIEEVELYKNIEKLFEFVLPEFENVWSYINSIKLYDNIVGDWSKYYGDKKYSNDFKKLSLKNKNLQVITKIVRISLDKDNLEGAWHVEGMSHENIIATASCTLEQSKYFNAELFFKRIYTLAEVIKLVKSTHQNPFYELSNLLNKTYVPLGKINIKEGSLIVFPNSHVHKIDMESTMYGRRSRMSPGLDSGDASRRNPNTKSHRTIVVFWLINPNIRITSTNDIKQQNYNIQKAYKNRLELMKERTFYKKTFNQRDLNLCEH